MTVIKRFVGNSSIYIIAGMLNASIPFLLLPILTRFLTPAEYGVLAVFNVWMSFTFVVCSLNVHASANREYFDKNKEELGVFIFNCLIIVLASSFISLALVFFLQKTIGGFLNVPEELLILGLALSIVNIFIQIRLGQWQVREKPIYFGVFVITQSVVNMFLSLLFVVYLEEGLHGRVTAITISIAFFAAIALLLLCKDNLIKVSFKYKHIKESLQFGLPLVPHSIGAFFLLSIDRAVISSKLGTEAAGIYMVAFQFALVVSLLLDSVNKAFSPWLYKLLKEGTIEAKKLVVKVTYWLYFTIFAGVCISFLFAEYFVNLLVGEEFSDAAVFVPLLICAQGIRGAYLFVTNYLFYMKKTHYLSLITIFTGSVNIILVYFAIDFFGVIGAAYSLLFSMFLQWILTWWLANKVVKMPWFSNLA